MPHRLLLRRLAIAAAALLAAPASVTAMTAGELVDHELNHEPVAFTRLEQGTLSYFDSQRRLQSVAVEQFVQLRGIGGREPRVDPTLAVAELTDGQRFVGTWLGASHDGAALRWQHEQLGELALPLDRLRHVRLATRDGAAGDAQPTPAQDVVVLANGDRLRGFVVELTDTGVTLQADGGQDAWTLPHERIALLRLANPADDPTPGRHTLALADGSRVAVAGLVIARELARFDTPLRSSSEQGTLALGELADIDFTGHGARLVALGDQPMRVIAGGEVFGLSMPPHHSAGALRLHAPITVEFDLPDTARRFAAVAELAVDDDDAPDQLNRWADLELIVRHEGEQKRYRLHGSQPRVHINLPIHGETLQIELDPGMNGPILDRLRLRDAVLLIHDADHPASAHDPKL